MPRASEVPVIVDRKRRVLLNPMARPVRTLAHARSTGGWMRKGVFIQYITIFYRGGDAAGNA